jgi:hypothetical protein
MAKLLQCRNLRGKPSPHDARNRRASTNVLICPDISRCCGRKSRAIHAAPGRFFPLALPQPPLHDTATDPIALEQLAHDPVLHAASARHRAQILDLADCRGDEGLASMPPAPTGSISM